MKFETNYDAAVAAIQFVKGEIAKRMARCLKRLPQATQLLADLSESAGMVQKGQTAIEDMGPQFNKGIKQVLDDIYGFLSGYSSNGEQIVTGEAMNKAAETFEGAMGAFDANFSKLVELPADATSDATALAGLRELYATLKSMLDKSLNWQDTGGANPSIHKDPFQTDKTKETGSVVAIATAASGPVNGILKSDAPERAALQKAAEAVFKASEENLVEAWPLDLTSWTKPRR